MKQAKQTLFDKFLVKKIKNTQQTTQPLIPKSQDTQNKQKQFSQSHKIENHIKHSVSPIRSTSPLAPTYNNPAPIFKYPTIKAPQIQDNNTWRQQKKMESLQQQNHQVAAQLILIGPFDIVNAEEEQTKLQQLLMNCGKKAIIQWIRYKNEGKNYPKDFKNIQKINDQQFWCYDMQRIITLLLREERQYNSCIQMLPQLNLVQSITLTRKQIFLLISAMFLSILPPQINNYLVSFAELMAVRPADDKYKQKPPVRLQKLKCVINYLKYMLRNQQIFNQTVTFQRAYSYQSFTCKEGTALSPAQIQSGKIQSGYGKGIMIDFANSNVGGGFLTNGSAQQEILFSIFPQMIVIKLLCENLRDQEAILVHGARRINQYEGYSHYFKYKNTFYDQHMPYQSCIVAVDAVDFTKGIMNKSMQYGQKFVKRELLKIFLGIQAASAFLKEGQVYTGRWGCGVFGADQNLKFCIQWIACSEAGRSMRFFTDEDTKIKQLSVLVQNIKHLTTMELLSVIESYGKLRGCNEKGFLQYLKYNI